MSAWQPEPKRHPDVPNSWMFCERQIASDKWMLAFFRPPDHEYGGEARLMVHTRSWAACSTHETRQALKEIYCSSDAMLCDPLLRRVEELQALEKYGSPEYVSSEDGSIWGYRATGDT